MRCFAPYPKLSSNEGDMEKRKPQGQYRTDPAGNNSPMVYVWGNGSPTYVTEAIYRSKGYLPAFDDLPTEDEYDAQP